MTAVNTPTASAIRSSSANVPTTGRIAFEVEARLLQELGERLVASAEVALLELVKNSSDADAPECRVILTSIRGHRALLVADDGDGMTFDWFRNRWMRIATNSKRESHTQRFGRRITGQKGIGRFAIRFLGAAVRLESVSEDPTSKKKYKLEAVFDWRRLDKRVNLNDVLIPYRVTEVDKSHRTGTILTVTRLKQDLSNAYNKDLLTRVLQIVSPSTAFDAGPFTASKATGKEQDQGFKVSFIGFSDDAGNSDPEFDLAKEVVDHGWARLKISTSGSDVRYRVTFRDEPKHETLKFKYPNFISRGLYADIVFAPKRKDAFKDVNVDRRRIWTWFRDNSGIGVVDNGFRIRPYGFEDDDWLFLNRDGAHNERDWRSPISHEYFPLSELERARPGLNPALNVPASYQVIGLVNVASKTPDDSDVIDVIPSMDREGFLINEAFNQLVEIVRGGVEFLAMTDKHRMIRLEEEAAAESRAKLRKDFDDAVAAIDADPRLDREEKSALVHHYSSLAYRITEQEEYDRSARQRLEIAAGLGVVAGFMTHEAERLFLALDGIVEKLIPRAARDLELRKDLEELLDARQQLNGYIRYTRLYTESLRGTDIKPFSALGQIEWIIDNFGQIATSRGISTTIQCEPDVEVPAIPVALYSGVLLNLYSNAAKAVIARVDSKLKPQIQVSAWNDAKTHYLAVQDSGIGIPPELTERIWDPFFTTTSRVNSPLGTGMGLGLSLVKDLVSRVDGKVLLADPDQGFSTCFQVSIPRKT